MNVDIINPCTHPHWDDLLLTAPRASFFHTTAWARVLQEAYGYTPLYFATINEGRLEGLIPVMQIDSFLTGRRGVSLPFTDFCPLVAADRGSFQALWERVREYGCEQGWKSIELRGGSDRIGKAPSFSVHIVHRLKLGPDDTIVSAGFRSSTRRNIRKAESAGVGVSLLFTRDSVDAFYRLNCLTRKRHGLPPQPRSFFEKIFEHVISRHKGFVVLADCDGRAVAGAVYFHFNGECIYKYGASDQAAQHLRPNNLAMWAAIKWGCRSGQTAFHFGRTEPENQGLLQFKRGWGTIEEELHYYKYDLKNGRFRSENSGPEAPTGCLE